MQILAAAAAVDEMNFVYYLFGDTAVLRRRHQCAWRCAMMIDTADGRGGQGNSQANRRNKRRGADKRGGGSTGGTVYIIADYELLLELGDMSSSFFFFFFFFFVVVIVVVGVLVGWLID